MRVVQLMETMRIINPGSTPVETNGTRAKPACADGDTSAPEVLERLVQEAERAEASDIHLHMRDGSASVSFRLDGVMTQGTALPAEIAARVFGRLKCLA